MKRTLVERVATVIWESTSFPTHEASFPPRWSMRIARRIIAMVRRHDRKERGR